MLPCIRKSLSWSRDQLAISTRYQKKRDDVGREVGELLLQKLHCLDLIAMISILCPPRDKLDADIVGCSWCERARQQLSTWFCVQLYELVQASEARAARSCEHFIQESNRWWVKRQQKGCVKEGGGRLVGWEMCRATAHTRVSECAKRSHEQVHAASMHP